MAFKSLSLQFGESVEKNTNDAVRRLCELGKAFNERLTLENPRLAERYLKMEIWVHVHVRLISKSSFDAMDYCAIFEQEGGSDGKSDLSIGVKRNRIANSAYCYEKMVLIRNIESMERIQDRVVASLVRFERLDQAHRFCAGTLYYSLITGFKFLNTTRDGEGCSVIGRPSVGEYEPPNKVIEAGSEIVNDLAYNDSPSVPSERRFAEGAYPKDPIAGFRLIIGNDSIGFAFEKGVDLGFEVTDLLFGPFDLSFDRGNAR